jgi:hypothetical protein
MRSRWRDGRVPQLATDAASRGLAAADVLHRSDRSGDRLQRQARGVLGHHVGDLVEDAASGAAAHGSRVETVAGEVLLHRRRAADGALDEERGLALLARRGKSGGRRMARHARRTAMPRAFFSRWGCSRSAIEARAQRSSSRAMRSASRSSASGDGWPRGLLGGPSLRHRPATLRGPPDEGHQRRRRLRLRHHDLGERHRGDAPRSLLLLLLFVIGHLPRVAVCRRFRNG